MKQNYTAEKSQKGHPPVKYFSNRLAVTKKLKTVAKKRKTVPLKMIFLRTEDFKLLLSQPPKDR